MLFRDFIIETDRMVKAHPGYGYHMNGYGMGENWNGWAISHMVFWIVLLGLLLFAVVSVLRSSRSDEDQRKNDRPSARELLDERYARGEIDREEYLQRKKDLND